MNSLSWAVRSVAAIGICFFLIKDIVTSGLDFQELKLMMTLLITFVFFNASEP